MADWHVGRDLADMHDSYRLRGFCDRRTDVQTDGQLTN